LILPLHWCGNIGNICGVGTLFCRRIFFPLEQHGTLSKPLCTFCIRNRAAFQSSCHFGLPVGLGWLWNTPYKLCVCQGSAPLKIGFVSGALQNVIPLSSFHPSITTYCGSPSWSQNPSLIGLLVRDGWNFEICWVLFPHDVPNDVHNLFSVCFLKIYPRWYFAKCCFHCSQKFQCVSLMCLAKCSQMFPPYICSQCFHLTYVYIPYVLQSAPNPVPDKPQILFHNLCLKCSLT